MSAPSFVTAWEMRDIARRVEGGEIGIRDYDGGSNVVAAPHIKAAIVEALHSLAEMKDRQRELRNDPLPA